MYAVEVVQPSDRLEIQTDAMSLLLGLRMNLAVTMGNHYLSDAEVAAIHYPLSDFVIVGSGS